MSSPDELRYPVGRFNLANEGTRADQIATLRRLPAELGEAVSGLSEAQLDTPYRDGGWTIRQVVHHLADSHANSYIRVKLALTEDNPTIKPYNEAAWAQLPDSRMPVEVSLPLIEAVHARLLALLEPLSDQDFARTFAHPERGSMTLAQNLALYAWHSRHHLAHITRLRERMGW